MTDQTNTTSATLYEDAQMQTVVATVEIPAFPDMPPLIEYRGEIYLAETIGYGELHYSYIKTPVFYVKDSNGRSS